MDGRKSLELHRGYSYRSTLGLREYNETEKRKLRHGRGGVWRIPPRLMVVTESPLPRFTTLTDEDKDNLSAFFVDFARRALRILVPGGHIMMASNPLLSHLVFGAIDDSGLREAWGDHTTGSNPTWWG